MTEKLKHYRLNTGSTVFNSFNSFPPPAGASAAFDPRLPEDPEDNSPVAEALKDQAPKDHCIDCKVELTLENEVIRQGEAMWCKECWHDLPF